MLDQYRISLLTFPQAWDGTGNLRVQVLVVPQLGNLWNGNPLQDLPLGFPAASTVGPAFAQASVSLEARVVAGLDQFPAQAPVDASISLAPAAPAADAVALFSELQAQFDIKDTVTPTDLAETPQANRFIKKYLTRTYRNAFHFTAPRVPEAVTDDSYHCAVKEDKQKNPAFQESPPEVTWGKVYAFCLRHPLLARRLGLIREADVPVDPAMFTEGGFLYMTLGADSDYVAGGGADDHFHFVRHYAARIPPLEVGSARTLFAPVLFPVLFNVAGPDGNYDQVFIEASEYDDGFAKIVHSNQPVSQHLLEEEEDGFPPLSDIGIRVGWDDEQVLIWQNRQLQEQKEQPGSGKRLDAPLGVFGYRIDARPQGDPTWRSLVRARSKNALQLGNVTVGAFDGELGVEVHPMQLDGDQGRNFWLPSYFANWNGHSLVLPDEDAAALYKTEQASSQAVALGRLYDSVGLEDVPLRYGNLYDFRVRLMDATGGGPEADAAPANESEAPVSTLHFKRHVVPEPLRVDDLPRLPEQPVDTHFAGDSLVVRRPLLGYPSVVYTGKYADPIPLLQAASDAMVGVESFGIDDPDVLRVQVDVEVRTFDMDNRMSLSGREPFIHLYRTTREFPAEFGASLSIPLEFVDAHVLRFGNPADLGDLGVTEADLAGMDQLVLPTAREVRVTLRGMGDGDANYYGGAESHVGKPTQVLLRRASSDESDLLAEASLSRQIRGLYFQPDPPQPNDGDIRSLLLRRGTDSTPALIQRLAEQLDVEHKGLTLVGEKGQRVVFGCSRRIRHTLSPDNSSITFASKDDLLNHWVVALSMQVDRDWTWDGLNEVGFEVFRQRSFPADGDVDDNGGRPIGDLEVKRTAPISALHDPDRSKVTLIYLDAVEPKSSRPQPGNLQETAFPDAIDLHYRIEPRFRTQPDQEDPPRELDLDLPVTTPPAQVPRIVSAGIALSKYQRDAEYSATTPRERFLWIEFEEPLRDPNDMLFARSLGYAPDPLLSDNRFETFVPPDEPPLNIDPELIRVITPGQSDDQAGLSAMQPMEQSTDSDRHYLLPLPHGLHAESSELFGFQTYEVRVGHAKIWSTAQGRFGRPLRTTGVQHPAPTLFCTSHRDTSELLVEAPHAMAVMNGKNITAHPPRTEIWALLYAQVRQADGKDQRNILLDERKLALIPRKRESIVTAEGQVVLAKGNENAPARSSTRWLDSEVDMLLGGLGLPAGASLSVLCVEMMPHFGSFQRDAATSATVESEPLRERSFVESVATVRSNAAGAPAGSAPGGYDGLRPLSNQLGHFRILRTSPLTPVPDVC